ncbi:MAG: PilZ domain-containing protein [Planctomycetota bacterium]|nr:MAG: PilZ domain-containing protein [Planctomycetota bacterium]
MQTDEIVRLTRDVLKKMLSSRAEKDHKKIPAVDRRLVSRETFPAVIEIWPINGDGRTHWLAICQNLSTTGLGMISDKPFEVDTKLEIAVHQPEATLYGMATVRHCTETQRGYLSGLEFDFDD